MEGCCNCFVGLVEFSAKPQGFDVLLQEEKLKSPTTQIAINTNLFIGYYLML
tara:strand:- start:715 stop:870 length:156 start_codon:yes stop_codon:yes gene_type:complete